MFTKILGYVENLYEEVESFYKILQLLKKLWKFIEYIIIIVYIFIFLISIDVIREWIIGLRDDQIYKDFVYQIYNHRNLSLFILLSILIFAFLYKIWKLSKIKISKFDDLNDFMKKLHEEFLHDVRDNIKELDNYVDSLVSENEGVRNLAKSKMYQELCNNLQNYVDLISYLLSDYCKTTISVCVKMIKFENNNIENPLAVTLARSTNTRNDRLKENETVAINENDDFKYLYNGSNTFYGKVDLEKEYKNDRYHVSEDFLIWSKKYNSTLIAPIRYYSKHSRHNNMNLEFDILGFLCIDATSSMEEWEKIDSYELKILAVFADTLYTYLKKFKEVYNVKKENRKIK